MGLLGFTCLASQVSGHGWEVHFPNSEENCLVLEGSRQDSTQHQGDLCSQSHYGQRGAKEGKLATKHEVVWESGHGCCGACDGCYGACDGNVCSGPVTAAAAPATETAAVAPAELPSSCTRSCEGVGSQCAGVIVRAWRELDRIWKVVLFGLCKFKSRVKRCRE